MKKIALTFMSALTVAALSFGTAFAAQSPSAQSPSSQSPSAQSPSSQSPSAQSPSSQSPSSQSPSSESAVAGAESTAAAQGEEAPQTSPQTGLNLDLAAGASVALLIGAGAAGVALRKEIA